MVRSSFTFEGKRYYLYGKDETDLAVKKALKLKELQENRIVYDSSLTVEEWSYKAVELYKTNQKDITKTKYLQRMKHCIIDEIGHYKLKDVTPIVVQEVMNLQIGKSKTQINEVYQTLHFIFDTAEDNDLIPKSPCKKLVRPQGYKKKRHCLTPYEKEIFLKVCNANSKYDLFLVMLYCGLRPSEARELKGEDITEIKGIPVIKVRGTKTVNAVRTVPIPLWLAEKIKKEGHCFTRSNGLPHDLQTYKRLCHSLYRDMNIAMGCKTYRNQLIPPYPLREDFVPYDLRHTYATALALNQNIPMAVTKELLGHSNISTTVDFYTHISEEKILEVANIINP